MPWVHDEQSGSHYVRPRKKKEANGPRTRRIIIEPNPPKPAETAERLTPAVVVPGQVPCGTGDDASGDAGSDPSAGGDRLDPGVRPGVQSEAGEGRGPEPTVEEQRSAEGDAPAVRKPRSAKQLANDQRLREAAARRRLA